MAQLEVANMCSNWRLVIFDCAPIVFCNLVCALRLHQLGYGRKMFAYL